MKKKSILIVFTMIFTFIFVNYGVTPTYAATVDTTPPKLISISVDEEDFVAGQEYSINLVAEDDVSGVASISLEFANLAKEGIKYTIGVYNYPNATISIPQDMVSGKYTLASVNLGDNNNNYINYQNDNYYSIYSKSLDSKDIITINVVNNTLLNEDTVPPVISNITASSESIKINDTVSICADIEDDSQLKQYYDVIWIYNVEKEIFIQFGTGLQKEGEGNRYCASGTITNPGTYYLTDMYVPDIFNNTSHIYSKYSNSGPDNNSSWTYVESLPSFVVEGLSDDEEPPVLKSIKINKSSLIAPGSLQIFVEAEDNSGDFLTIKARFISEEKINKNEGFGEVELYLGYDQLLNKYVGTADFNQYVPSGTYYLQQVDLMDSKGNASQYESEKWKSTGMSLSDMDFRYISKFEVIEDLTFIVEEEVKYNEVSSTTNPNLLDIINSKEDDAVIMIDASNNYTVSADIFEAIKDTNKTIYVEANGYQWVFNGKDITNPKTINTYVYSELLIDDNINNLGQEYVAIVFADNGELPGKATIRVKTDYTFKYIEGVTNLKLYLYNPSEGKYFDTEETVELAEDGFYEFDITHNSVYILSNKVIEEELLSDSEEIEGELVPSEKAKDKESNTVDNKKNMNINILLCILIALFLIIVVIVVVVVNKNKDNNPKSDIQV